MVVALAQALEQRGDPAPRGCLSRVLEQEWNLCSGQCLAWSSVVPIFLQTKKRNIFWSCLLPHDGRWSTDMEQWWSQQSSPETDSVEEAEDQGRTGWQIRMLRLENRKFLHSQKSRNCNHLFCSSAFLMVIRKSLSKMKDPSLWFLFARASSKLLFLPLYSCMALQSDIAITGGMTSK